MGIADDKLNSRFAPPPPHERDSFRVTPEVEQLINRCDELIGENAYLREDNAYLLDDNAELLGDLQELVEVITSLRANITELEAQRRHLEDQRAELLPWAKAATSIATDPGHGYATVLPGDAEDGQHLFSRIVAGEFGEVAT